MLRGLYAGFRLQLSFFRNYPDQLIPLLTAPLYTIIFTMVVREGGREDLTGHVALAPFYMSLWWFALYSGGRVIDTERVEGTIEYLVGALTGFLSVVMGRIGTTMVTGLAAFVEVWLFARYALHADVTIHHTTVFLISLLLTLFAMAATALFLANLFVLTRSAFTFSNSASYPLYLLGGILVPVTLLPGWLQPISNAVFLSWSARLLRASLDPGPLTDPSLDLFMIFVLGAAAFAVASVMLALILRRVRQSGELGLL